MFGEDVEFLKKHRDVVLLASDDKAAQVALVPEFQGRVMTSTADSNDGTSYGWICRENVASSKRDPHINVFGGEDRFWLGPEGGQYSIFFREGDPFDLAHWRTPSLIDWGPWDAVHVSDDRAQFRQTDVLTNYSGTKFELQVDRVIQLLSRESLTERIGIGIDVSLKVVAYESDNRVTNIGLTPWCREDGLLSIWILGMFNPSDSAVSVLPFKPGPEDAMGAIVNDAYFGKVPDDRLTVADGAVFFRADGKHRAKIGVSPHRAKPVIGSYHPEEQCLTLVQYSLPQGATDYVNSMWEVQDEPFAGDVVNSYNDGPPEPGAKPLGPFFELETSSPALLLDTDQTASHVNMTAHIQGPDEALDPISRATLGLGLSEIRNAFA